MTPEQFVEKAIEGGWKEFLDFSFLYNIGNTVTLEYGKTKETVEKLLHEILLDPNAWEAVGKSLGWEKELFELQGNSIFDSFEGNEVFKQKYFVEMHQMIDHLIDGGTIESYLGTL